MNRSLPLLLAFAGALVAGNAFAQATTSDPLGINVVDEPTITRLKHSVGGVPENLWGRLKNLPTGQAIVSAHGIDPALIVALEPGRCQLRMVD